MGRAMNWHERMLEDMEEAYIAFRNGGDDQATRTALVGAMQRYFAPGMKADAAFVLLRSLREADFEVSEYRHYGARVWPNGEFMPYWDGATRHNRKSRYRDRVSAFVARKRYGHPGLMTQKNIVISFRIEDGSGVISAIEGDFWIDFIQSTEGLTWQSVSKSATRSRA